MLRLIAVALWATACGTATTDTEEVEGDPLTCDTLADTGFCWNTAVQETYACIPAADNTGTFDASRSTCTLGSGIEVVFDDPVPADPFDESADGYLWTFSIMDASGECGRFVDGDGAYTIHSGSGVTRMRGFGMVGLQVLCPDDSSFVADNAFDLLSCEDSSPPGFGYSGNVAWQLFGGPEGQVLFSCE